MRGEDMVMDIRATLVVLTVILAITSSLIALAQGTTNYVVNSLIIDVIYANYTLVELNAYINDVYVKMPIIGYFISDVAYLTNTTNVTLVIFNVDEGVIEVLTTDYPIIADIKYLASSEVTEGLYYVINITYPTTIGNLTITMPLDHVILNIEPEPHMLAIKNNSYVITFMNTKQALLEYTVLPSITEAPVTTTTTVSQTTTPTTVQPTVTTLTTTTTTPLTTRTETTMSTTPETSATKTKTTVPTEKTTTTSEVTTVPSVTSTPTSHTYSSAPKTKTPIPTEEGAKPTLIFLILALVIIFICVLVLLKLRR